MTDKREVRSVKKDVFAYNIIFPASMLYFGALLFPVLLCVLLPANFLADTVMLLLLFYFMKLPRKASLYKKMILKTWGFGFLADFIASTAMYIISSGIRLPFEVYGSTLPWKNPGGFLFITAGILLAGILIYLFQQKIVLEDVVLEERQKHRLALGMAVLTAPYLMYFPPIGG